MSMTEWMLGGYGRTILWSQKPDTSVPKKRKVGGLVVAIAWKVDCDSVATASCEINAAHVSASPQREVAIGMAWDSLMKDYERWRDERDAPAK